MVDEVNAYTYGLSTSALTTFCDYKVEMYRDIEKYGNAQDKTILKKIKKMEAAVDKSLFKGKLVLDDTEAKVYGLSEEAVAKICLGIVELHNVGLTSKEIFSVLMHEIGHCYYGLRYINQTKMHNNELNTNIQAIIKNPKDINKKINHVSIDGVKLENTGTTTTNIITVVGRTIASMERSKESTMKENERLADQFATRFGYGASLASAVRVVEKVIGKRFVYFEVVTHGLWYFTIIGIALMVIAPLFALITLEVMAAIVITSMRTNILTFILALFFPDVHLVSPKDYDDIKIRLERLKQDINKQLAEDNSNKEMVKSALESIDRLQKQIDSTPYDKTIAQALASYLVTGDEDSVEILKNRLDAVAGNDIHKHANRFSLL